MTFDEIRVLRGDERPSALFDLASVPEELFVRGSLPESLSVAIVGTRRGDAAGLAFAHRLAHDLARVGFGIVSGGAEGIDAAAHRGALEAGGRTWVVHATPLDDLYPKRHRRLFQEILDAGGGWLGETAPGEPVHKGRFLARNRLIAALADAVVVVQAPFKSGALSTARWARELERPLFAVPASPWDPRGAGCLALLERGAAPCTRADDVASRLGRRVHPLASRRGIRPEEPEQRKVLDALGARPRSVDDLVHATGLGVIRVRIALIQLAARDLADQSPHGWRAVGAA